MRRINHKKNLITCIILLLVFAIGIGYAYLTSNLSITGATEVVANTWNIHFENLNVKEGSVTASSPATIQSNNVDITYSIDLNRPKEYYEFTVDVKNDGTLPGKVSISTLSGITTDASSIIDYSIKYTNGRPVKIDDILNAGAKKTIKVRVFYKDDINPSDFPSNNLNLTLTYTLQYVQSESDQIESMLATREEVLKNTYLSDTYRDKIKTITLQDRINVPNNAVITWDLSAAQDNSVKGFLLTNSTDNTMYDLYIQGDKEIIANVNSAGIFENMRNIDSITGLDVLDTSNVTNMSGMFTSMGYNSSVFTLDLENYFDTSNVTNMEGMFAYAGYNSSVFTLDLGDNFDTSNVTNMQGLFYSMGANSTGFVLDLGNKFDIHNITSMTGVFGELGASTIIFGNDFDTSNVTDMSGMFSVSKNLTSLDLSSFDTKNVTDMSGMFSGSKNLTSLDLSSFDTSNVTNMAAMFSGSKNLTSLDLSSFDTSNVTNMLAMFSDCTNLSVLNLNNWDFSKSGINEQLMLKLLGNNPYIKKLSLDNAKFGTSMSGAFDNLTNLEEISLRNVDTSNVTNMNGLFVNDNKLTNLDLSSFDTSNVTNMVSMFYNASGLVSINLSSFDTSKVTEMSTMFKDCSSLTNLNLLSFNTSKVQYFGTMFSGTTNLSVLDLSSFDVSSATDSDYMFENTGATIGYAKDQTSAQFFNNTSNKPATLQFTVK